MKKHALITGASSGLGQALAKELASRGYNLTLSARRLDRLEDLRDLLFKEHPGIDILVVPADMAEKSAVNDVVDQSIKHFSHLDVFVANAGQGMWCRFRDLSDPDQVNQLMQINYMGVVYGLFFALPHLRKAGGSFVAISSIQGTIPVAFHTGYVASKYAVNGLIETMRLEEPEVNFLLALPAWISGTELRASALSGQSDNAIQVNKKHGKSAVPAPTCATQIIDALERKSNEVFIPKKYKYVPWLRQLCKKTFDRVVMNKVKSQLKDV